MAVVEVTGEPTRRGRAIVNDKMREGHARSLMLMKLRILVALLFFSLAAQAQRAMTVAEVITFVKSQIKMKGDDRTTADFLLHKIKLTEKLDDRTVEQLQGEGAGPKTVQALRK